MSGHPLDRATWNALNGPMAELAVAKGAAVRIDPRFGPFAAARDTGEEAQRALTAIVRETGRPAGLLERAAWPIPPGLIRADEGQIVQMVLDRPVASPAGTRIAPLGDADAGAMAALASAAEPGPWAELTHRYGGFCGIRVGGTLAAMAGTRLRLNGYRELSGVATSPAFRGRGLAEALSRHVCAAIQARGEVPFLHVFAANAGAIRIYEKLGFRHRATLQLTVLSTKEVLA